MRIEFIVLWCLVATLLGCGASHSAREPGDSEPSDRMVACPEATEVVRLAYPAEGVDITATTGLRVARNIDMKPIGFANDLATADGECFILGRDGDGTDGAFDHPGTYDASRYPYHMALYVWSTDPAAACAGTSSATAYYALGGSWNIDTPTPMFTGSAYVTSLTHTESCWTEAGGAAANTSACALLRGGLSVCFKVANGP